MARYPDDYRAGSLRWTNWPMITVGLVQRGYTDADILKIVGGNILRVLDAVARTAEATHRAAVDPGAAVPSGIHTRG